MIGAAAVRRRARRRGPGRGPGPRRPRRRCRAHRTARRSSRGGSPVQRRTPPRQVASVQPDRTARSGAVRRPMPEGASQPPRSRRSCPGVDVARLVADRRHLDEPQRRQQAAHRQAVLVLAGSAAASRRVPRPGRRPHSVCRRPLASTQDRAVGVRVGLHRPREPGDRAGVDLAACPPPAPRRPARVARVEPVQAGQQPGGRTTARRAPRGSRSPARLVGDPVPTTTTSTAASIAARARSSRVTPATSRRGLVDAVHACRRAAGEHHRAEPERDGCRGAARHGGESGRLEDGPGIRGGLPS